MRVEPTEISGIVHVLPRILGDERGFFVETFNRERYAAHGIEASFLQDNLSRSAPGILRGLHFQHPRGQGKLVSVLEGSVFDVAVDIRVGSPTFGRYVSQILDAERKNQLWIPTGFAHGFFVMGETAAVFSYKCTELYAPEHELAVAWNDPALGIEWPLTGEPTLSAKDRSAARLAEIDPGRLPRFEA